MSCCELYTHLISTRGLRGGKTKNKKNLLFRPSACWVKQNWIFWQRLAAPSRASVCPWQTEAVLMQVYRLNLCDDVNALEQKTKTKKTKTKTWNRQSLTVSAPCTRVINCLYGGAAQHERLKDQIATSLFLSLTCCMTCLHGGFKHKMIHHPHRGQDKNAKLLKKIKKQLEKKKKKKCI